MKLTKMRKNGQKLNSEDFNALIVDLHNAIKAEGFITEIQQVNSQCIKLGLHMRSFNIDLSVHGYNTQHSMGRMKRTNLPSWDQRVTYNDTLNKILDQHNISCNIKSGPYTIRQGLESMTERDWEFQKPEWQHQNEIRGYYVEEGDYKEAA